jgi:hypothetical protein
VAFRKRLNKNLKERSKTL